MGTNTSRRVSITLLLLGFSLAYTVHALKFTSSGFPFLIAALAYLVLVCAFVIASIDIAWRIRATYAPNHPQRSIIVPALVIVGTLLLLASYVTGSIGDHTDLGSVMVGTPQLAITTGLGILSWWIAFFLSLTMRKEN